MIYRAQSPIDDYTIAVGKRVRIISNEAAEHQFRIGDIGVIKQLWYGDLVDGKWVVTPEDLLRAPNHCTVKVCRNWFTWHLFTWQVELI